MHADPKSHARTWAYRACQLGGWGGYAGINIAFGAGAGSAKAFAVQAAFVSACGALLTHLLRRRVGAAWAALGITRLLPRLLIAAAVLGLTLAVLAVGMMQLTMPPDGQRPFPVLFAIVAVFNFSIVFLVWELLYFGEHLVTRSRRAELSRLALVGASREAELAALKAQLNPHFLFNCLNSIRALITEDPSRAEHVVTLLSELLRHSLSSSALATVPLARELDVVRLYLELEGVRLEERLRVSIDVDADCLTVPVPGMLVQSLVENAIKHGVARLPSGGEVTVRGRLEAGQLHVTVANSAGTSSPALAGTGVGLRNAAERLRLLFGPLASVELLRARAELTEAHLRLPAGVPR